MSGGLTSLRRQLEDLRGSGLRLGKSLRAAALDLDASGTLFPATLISDLRGYSSALRELRTRTFQAAHSSRQDEGRGDSASLGELSAILRRAKEEHRRQELVRQVRERALHVLERVAAIECPDDPAFPHLAACRDAAAEARQRILSEGDADPSVEAVDLAERRHPLCALLELVQGTEAIDDERWGALHDSVAGAFGRSLSAAVARGRLRMSADSSPAAPETHKKTPEAEQEQADAAVRAGEPNPPHSPRDSSASRPGSQAQEDVRTTSPKVARPMPGPRKPAAAPRAETAQPSSKQTRPNTAAEVKAEAPAARSAAGAKPSEPAIDLDSVIVANEAGDAVIMRGGASPKTVTAPKTVSTTLRGVGRRAANTTPVLAQTALEASGKPRQQIVSNLLWRLCLEGRLGIAAHLAGCLEQRSDVEVPFLPSVLMRTLGLAPHVQFPLGEISRQLTNDFARLRHAPGPRNDAEWAVAWQLLLTAAALRPALLAPASGASGVLHNLRMIEGLSRLYNYTHRIVIFADAGKPLDVNAFKRARSEQAWESELQQLLAEVDGWCSQSSARRLRYSATTHCFLRSHWSVTRPASMTDPQIRSLWRIWQTLMDRLHRFLEPVRANRLDAAATVQSNIEQLSDPAEVDRIVSGALIGRRLTAGSDAGARDQLRQTISEAVGLARRWLRLHESTPEQRAPAVPRRSEELFEERRAMQLRDEVLSRQDAVLKELKSVAERYTNAPIVTGIACCCRSIEQIRRLFDPDEPVATAEADPRPVLNADLLRIPSLTLNDLWEPDVSSNELETAILHMLARPIADWRATFDARSDEGDHEATGRLLQLDVWKNETEVRELGVLRDRRIAACRESLLRDVDATRTRVTEAFTLGLIQDRDRDLAENEIAAVESAGASSLRFAGWHRRLSEIREALERRRQYEIQRVRDRFDQLHLKQENPFNARIDAALNDGNVATAIRYIDLAASGKPLPEGDWVR